MEAGVAGGYCAHGCKRPTGASASASAGGAGEPSSTPSPPLPSLKALDCLPLVLRKKGGVLGPVLPSPHSSSKALGRCCPCCCSPGTTTGPPLPRSQGSCHPAQLSWQLGAQRSLSNVKHPFTRVVYYAQQAARVLQLQGITVIPGGASPTSSSSSSSSPGLPHVSKGLPRGKKTGLLGAQRGWW